MADRWFENEQIERLCRDVMRSVRRRLADARAESPLNDSLAELYAPLPKLRKPIAERTTDELVAEMIAERDASIARAEAALAHLERLRLDDAAAERQRRGKELLQ
jgi:hypothetical protein